MNIFYRYTLKTLGKNKTRTFVTIIGIILSVAMFTAVTEAAYSGQQYLLNGIISTTGSFEGALTDITSEQLSSLKTEDNIKSLVTLQDIGYAEIGSNILGKPYLYIGGIEKNYTDLVAVPLIEGRMPENANEIVLPKHLKDIAYIDYKIGDTLNLKVGKRTDGTAVYTQDREYCENDECSEYLTDFTEKTYTVVGICARPDIEKMYAPGFTAYTLAEPGLNTTYQCFVTVDDVSVLDNNYSNYADFYGKYGNFVSVNYDFLAFSWRLTDDVFMRLVFGLGAVLIAIIFVGSVSLIYNSFSISVSERTKQFGILRSVGATKKQLIKSVLFEGLVLSAVAIPLGLLSGCVGLSVTFRLLKDEFTGVFSAFTVDGLTNAVTIRLIPNALALLLAAVIALFTVLVSALIPVKRAMRITPIDAVRMTNDVKMKEKNIKASPLVYKLFKFEGMLAQKNFKRNRKKYRTTVISLVLSLVLFISASSLCFYFNRSFSMRVEGTPYDIYAYCTNSSSDYTQAVASLKRLGVTSGVTDYAVVVKSISELCTFVAEENQLDKDYLASHSDENGNPLLTVSPTLTFVNDAAFNRLCLQNGIAKDRYYDKSHPLALLYDHYIRHTEDDEGNYVRTNAQRLNRDTLKDTLTLQKITGQTDTLLYSNYDAKKQEITFIDISSQDCVDLEKYDYPTVTVPYEGHHEEVIFHIGSDLQDNQPYFIEGSFCLIYPLSQLEAVLGEENQKFETGGYYVAPNHAAVFDAMKENITADDNLMLSDQSDDNETVRALMTLVKVFSYGFIVLISLIAAANVFNTISTNISLRRRELAMLKSVGLSEKGLKRMMNYESLLYGIKSLLFGLPLSLLITIGIFEIVIGNGFEMSFTLPWGNLALGIFSVFAVVFASMIYSVKKLQKYNTADELKNENI